MTVSSKRAEYVAMGCLFVALAFFVIVLIVGRWSGVFAVYAVSWLMLSAALICLVPVLQFHQRSLAEQEKLDMGQLARGEPTSTIFEAKGERAGLLAVAQRRLEVFEKWFIPAFSILICVYQILLGLYLLRGVPAAAEVVSKEPLVCAIYMTAAAFVAFLFSRYATGMSSEPAWKPLRAAGSSLLGAAVICFILGIGLAFVQFKVVHVLAAMGWVSPIVLIVLGVETGLNVVLDIYRPRVAGRYNRAAFDSRLLGFMNEPGGVFRSAAGAIDYQFGFKVSQTWFYKLLEKAIVPLVLFAGFTLYLMSCVVVVEPNEQAVIERFGNPIDQAGNKRIAGPGLSLKWPWPIDIAYKYPVRKVVELNIGFVPKTDPKTGQQVREPLLWGKAHYEQEYSVLVASEQSGRETVEGAVPVGLIKADIPVHYRVKDLYSFLYNYENAPQLLESICYRELARFAASARIEVGDGGQDSVLDQKSLLGGGRSLARSILTERIQKAADEEGLGIEIVFLGVQGIHPPAEEGVATAYQQVVGAVQIRQAEILKAQAERNTTLSGLAGSVEQAEALNKLMAVFSGRQSDANAGGDGGKELDAALGEAAGEIFTTLRQAQSYAFERATLARATGERFASQLRAYQAAPQIYMHDQRLTMYEESLAKIRKFVIVADKNDAQVYIVDLQEKLTPDLYDIAGFEESSKK